MLEIRLPATFSIVTCRESQNTIHRDWPTQTNTRSTTTVSTKIMNNLRLALTVGFLSLISPVLAGTGPELQPAPSPSDENKNSTELRSEEHTSELQSLRHLVCRLLLEKKKKNTNTRHINH